MTRASPELADLLAAALDSRLLELHVATIGQVVARRTDADDKRQFVDVLPSLRQPVPTEDDADETALMFEEHLPVIPRVPVCFPQGAGFAISWPLAAGDFVLLLFCDRSIDHWIATATKSQQTTYSPGDLGPHTLDGAVAIPLGPSPQASLLQSVSPTAMTLGKDGGMRIAIDATKIALGSPSAADFVALASKVDAELAKVKDDFGALKTTLAAHIHSGGTVLGNTGTPTNFTFTPHTPDGTGSTKIAAE